MKPTTENRIWNVVLWVLVVAAVVVCGSLLVLYVLLSREVEQW